MNDIKPVQSEAKSFLKNLFSFSIATWVGAIISFVVTPFATRMFPTDVMGKINMFFTVSTLIEYVALFGMNQAYIRFFNELPEKMTTNVLFKTCLSICGISSTVLGIAILVFNKFVSVAIIDTADFLIALELCLFIVARVFLTMSNCEYRMKLNVVMFTVQAIFMNLFQKVAFVFAGMNGAKANTAISYACITTTILLLIFIFAQRKLIFFKSGNLVGRKDISVLLKYAVPLIPALFLSYLNTSLPNLFLRSLIDYTALGIFSTAVTLVQIITLIQTGFNVFWTPYVFKNYSTKQPQIQNIHNIISFVMPCAGILILLFIDIIYLLLGASYRASQAYFGFMLLSPVLYTIAETTGLGINIKKKTYMSILVTMVTLITNVVGCVVLIPLIGALGAAISISISSCAMFISKTIIGEKYYKVVNNSVKTLSGIVAAIIAAVVNYIFMQSIVIKTGCLLVLLIALMFVYKSEVQYILKILSLFVSQKRQIKK